eukprot:CAMPEP_0114500312 /NCGR_PEP_ID=MMETSP0109-20121206/7895_1 /TAXON_ID=29199 /ORGANISM="Chlorarachnion reptans, Strain CCCM449" /LENGTH=55 /DNA_ID=CAMNT_0001677961 /DNA_START=596 /DNA_END=759 /DNA_ORIENTATION=+
MKKEKRAALTRGRGAVKRGNAAKPAEGGQGEGDRGAQEDGVSAWVRAEGVGAGAS